MSPLKSRLHAKVAGSFACVAVFIATLIEPQWFELLFDEAPDAGDGSLEAVIALACSALLGLLLATLARRDWLTRRSLVRSKNA